MSTCSNLHDLKACDKGPGLHEEAGGGAAGRGLALS